MKQEAGSAARHPGNVEAEDIAVLGGFFVRSPSTAPGAPRPDDETGPGRRRNITATFPHQRPVVVVDPRHGRTSRRREAGRLACADETYVPPKVFASPS